MCTTAEQGVYTDPEPLVQQTYVRPGAAQQKRYPTAAATSVPTAKAGAVVPVLWAGEGAGASAAVATPTRDEATTAVAQAAARILSLRVAAISSLS
jgi:hypothetical protein